MCNSLESLEYNNLKIFLNYKKNKKDLENNVIKIEHLKHIDEYEECRHLFYINNKNEACYVDKLFKPDLKTCWMDSKHTVQTKKHNTHIIVYAEGKDYSCQIYSNTVLNNQTDYSLNSNNNHTNSNNKSIYPDQPLSCDGSNTFNQLSIPYSYSLYCEWVATGYRHVCAINKVDGINCWGDNTYNQVEIPTEVSKHHLLIGNIVAGPYNTCVYFKYGSVNCWGWVDNFINTVPLDFIYYNYNSKFEYKKPYYTIVRNTVFQISISEQYACGIKIKLNVYPNILKCWGNCGAVCKLPDIFYKRYVPEQYSEYWMFYMNNNPYEVSTGLDHACAIYDTYINNGILICWGSNSHGQTNVPSAFANNTDTVKAGNQLNCAIKNNFYMQCWGVHQYVPPRVSDFTRQISSGGLHSCATINGSFTCWGSNKYGQAHTPVEFTMQRSAVEVKTGWNFTCGLAIDGYMGCWGENHYGQTDYPYHTYKWDLKAKMVSVGISHSCAILVSDMKVPTLNKDKQGYDNNYTESNRYQSMIVDKLWKLDVRNASRTHQANNLNDNVQLNPDQPNPLTNKMDSSSVLLVCWGGFNESGQRTVPNSFKHNVAEVAVGDKHTCALRSLQSAPPTSMLDCWGSNDRGQSDVPAPITHLDILLLSGGGAHTCVYLDYIQVYHSTSALSSITCWGSDRYGQSKMPIEIDGLYQNYYFNDQDQILETTESKSVDVSMIINKSSKNYSTVISALSAGIVHTCVIAMTVNSSWTSVCWGMRYEDDYVGMLNVNPYSLSSNWDHDCAADQNGTPVCWGNDDQYGKIDYNRGDKYELG